MGIHMALESLMTLHELVYIMTRYDFLGADRVVKSNVQNIY